MSSSPTIHHTPSRTSIDRSEKKFGWIFLSSILVLFSRAKTSLHLMSWPDAVTTSVILFCASHVSFPSPASYIFSRSDFAVEDAPVPPFSIILGNKSEMETEGSCCKKRKQVCFISKAYLWSKIWIGNKHAFLVTISKHDVTCDKRFFFVTSSFLYQTTICDKISVQKPCSSLNFLSKINPVKTGP